MPHRKISNVLPSEEAELLAKFRLGQRSLYDVRAYLDILRARGDGVRAASIERTIMLE